MDTRVWQLAWTALVPVISLFDSVDQLWQCPASYCCTARQALLTGMIESSLLRGKECCCGGFGGSVDFEASWRLGWNWGLVATGL